MNTLPILNEYQYCTIIISLVQKKFGQLIIMFHLCYVHAYLSIVEVEVLMIFNWLFCLVGRCQRHLCGYCPEGGWRMRSGPSVGCEAGLNLGLSGRSC